MSHADFDLEAALRDKQGIPLDRAHELTGQVLFTSDWRTLDEAHVRLFRASIDNDPKDIDMTTCLTNPVGDENVDAFMLLSLLQTFHFIHNPLYTVGMYGLNYGLEKVRFPASAYFGNRVRCVCVLDDVQPHARGYVTTTTNTLELEGSAKPCLVGTWRVLCVIPDAARAGT